MRNVNPQWRRRFNPVAKRAHGSARRGGLERQEPSVLDEIAADDYVELDPFPGQAPGRDGLRAFLETEMFPAFPYQQWVTEEQVTEGEKVVSRFTFYGTHQGNFMGIPATGRRIAVKGVVIDRVVDGKWKDSRILMDNLAMLQQLGVLPQTLTAATR